MTTAFEAWTEPVTNLVTMEPERFRREFPRWLDFGKAPRDLLSLFLHETTHHWCFHSPVGHAIALLSLRARRRFLTAVLAHARAKKEGPPPGTRIGPDDSHLLTHLLEAMAADQDLVGDLLRIEAASMMLRPLAEGLATFAEFDVSSKTASQILSTPLQWLTILFVDPLAWAVAPDPAQQHEMADIARHDVIRALRESPAALERKLNILARPFSADERGYLNGYLAVKSLWRTLSSRNFRAANETDLSLCYLRSFVYDDLGLVKRLLAPGPAERVASDVANHVNDRLWQLSEITAADFDAFEAEAVARPPGSPGDLGGGAGLLLEDGVAEECKALLDALAREVYDESGEVGALLGRSSLDMIALRQFLNIGEAAVELRAEDTGLVTVAHEGSPILKVAPLPNTGVADGPGWIELILTINGAPRLIVAVGQGDRLVASHLIGDSTGENLLDFIASVHVPRSQLLSMEDATVTALEAHLRENGVYDHLAENRARLSGFVDKVYRDIALRFSFEPGSRRTHDTVDATALKLQQIGLLALGPGGQLLSKKMARGMALLGMLCSIAPRRSYLEPVFAAAGLSLDETIGCMKAAHTEHGFPPIPFVGEDSVYSTL